MKVLEQLSSIRVCGNEGRLFKNVLLQLRDTKLGGNRDISVSGVEEQLR
jgi:hypothetical protein